MEESNDLTTLACETPRFYIRCMPSNVLVSMPRVPLTWPTDENSKDKPISLLLHPFAAQNDCDEDNPMVLSEMKKQDDYLIEHCAVINHPAVISRIAEYVETWSTDVAAENYRPFPKGNTPDGTCYVPHNNVTKLLQERDIRVIEHIINDSLAGLPAEQHAKYADGLCDTADPELNAWRTFVKIRAISQALYTVDNYFGMEGLTAKLYTYTAAILMMIDPTLLSQYTGDTLYKAAADQMYEDIYNKFGIRIDEIEQKAAHLNKSLDEVCEALTTPFIAEDTVCNENCEQLLTQVTDAVQAVMRRNLPRNWTGLP